MDFLPSWQTHNPNVSQHIPTISSDGAKKSHGWPWILPSHCPKLSSEPAFTPKVSTSSTLILRTDVSTWQAISKIEGYDVFSQKTSPHWTKWSASCSSTHIRSPKLTKVHTKKTRTFRTFAPHPHLYSIYVGNVNLTSSGSSFNCLFEGRKTSAAQNIPGSFHNFCLKISKLRSSTAGCWISCAKIRTFSTFSMLSATDRMIATAWPWWISEKCMVLFVFCQKNVESHRVIKWKNK